MLEYIGYILQYIVLCFKKYVCKKIFYLNINSLFLIFLFYILKILKIFFISIKINIIRTYYEKKNLFIFLFKNHEKNHEIMKEYWSKFIFCCFFYILYSLFFYILLNA